MIQLKGKHYVELIDNEIGEKELQIRNDKNEILPLSPRVVGANAVDIYKSITGRKMSTFEIKVLKGEL